MADKEPQIEIDVVIRFPKDWAGSLDHKQASVIAAAVRAALPDALPAMALRGLWVHRSYGHLGDTPGPARQVAQFRYRVY
jgi:hypothetical protein